MEVSFEIKRTEPGNDDFKKLVALLDADLKLRDGDKHAFFAQFNKLNLVQDAVVAYLNKEPVGCGALKKINEGTAEIKRMFVKPQYRGNGFAQYILAELERWAKEQGFTRCILETGKENRKAVRLYTLSGYKPIPNYDQYTDIEDSICMQKVFNK